MTEDSMEQLRQRLIGFGEQSSRKSYYPELQRKLEELKESEQRYRSIIENMQDVYYRSDAEGRLTMISPSGATLLGYASAEAMLGLPIRDTFYYDPAERDAFLVEVNRHGEVYGYEITLRHSDGTAVPVATSTHLLFDSVGSLLGVEGVFRDITERKRSEQVLQLSEQKFASIFRLMPDMVGITRMTDGCFIEVNDGFERGTGWPREEALGKSSLELGLWNHEDRAQAVALLQQQGHLEEFEFTMTKKSGEQRTALMYLLPITINGEKCLFFLARDITEHKQALEERINFEKQLLHSQKLESLGVLAGGIAHDFNNILMAIIGNADLALMRINKESPATENLRRIEQAAARAADLAKQMLAYSGKGRFVIEPIDLNTLLEEMLHMLEVSISKHAVLRFNKYTPLPAVEADATQLRQVIMNLVINASEAIGEKSGVIAITTGCMDCDRNYLKDVWLDENLADGLYVYLEIADTGCGMDKETMSRLFDPFFTTKFTGRGLGMAAVLGIVRGHKGAIKVYSEPGKGTSFKILLPTSDRPTELFNISGHPDDWRGTGTVMLVDDEESVRGIGSEMLKELGFTPLTANDGREALELFRQHPEISLVIMDLTMPHMDGEQCFRELRALSPQVRVIISSGFNEQEVIQRFVGKGLAGFIQKPYKLTLLRDSIKQLFVAPEAER